MGDMHEMNVQKCKILWNFCPYRLYKRVFRQVFALS